jgi:hypothetical protein
MVANSYKKSLVIVINVPDQVYPLTIVHKMVHKMFWLIVINLINIILLIIKSMVNSD